MAPYSSTFGWKIPWMEEPGRLQSMGLLRVRYDWVTSLSLFTFMHWRRQWQPIPVFLLGESQGRRSLVGCCLWGRTESDTTEATQQQQQQQGRLGLRTPVAQMQETGSIPGSDNPLEDGMALQHSCLESHGQRSLVDYSPQSCKNLDMTKHTCIAVDNDEKHHPPFFFFYC